MSGHLHASNQKDWRRFQNFPQTKKLLCTKNRKILHTLLYLTTYVSIIHFFPLCDQNLYTLSINCTVRSAEVAVG